MRIITLCSLLSLTACESDEVPLDTAANGVVTEPEDTDVADPSPSESPVAVCSSSPSAVQPPVEQNTFIGRHSYDPAGGTLVLWEWMLTAPDGSSRALSGAGADRTFRADQAGVYTAQLVVGTEDGRVSEPCVVDLTGLPLQALRIEMYWTHSGDDMDLHLLRPGGVLETSGDCYFNNCANSLDWGGDGADPTLEADDISGRGPEVISVPAPEFGTFTVVVHDYPGSVYEGANDVTVNVYVDYQLAWSDTRPIVGEDSYTTIAEVDWPTGMVRSMP